MLCPSHWRGQDAADGLHEQVFFKLIFNTKKDEEIRKDFGIVVDQDFMKKMNEVFGSRPSLANLRTFFSNEAIQGLWNNGFAVAD